MDTLPHEIYREITRYLPSISDIFNLTTISYRIYFGTWANHGWIRAIAMDNPDRFRNTKVLDVITTAVKVNNFQYLKDLPITLLDVSEPLAESCRLGFADCVKELLKSSMLNIPDFTSNYLTQPISEACLKLILEDDRTDPMAALMYFARYAIPTSQDLLKMMTRFMREIVINDVRTSRILLGFAISFDYDPSEWDELITPENIKLGIEIAIRYNNTNAIRHIINRHLNIFL